MNRRDRRRLKQQVSLEDELRRTLEDMQTGHSAVIKDVTTRELDYLIKPNDEIIPVFSSALAKFTNDQIRLWLHQNAVYQLITKELVEFLRPITMLGAAAEICAGAGTLGKALEIPCVDNFLQERPDMMEYYDSMHQPRIQYGSHLIDSEATLWVKKHRPDIVIAAWLTEKREGGLSIGAIEGPEEDKIEDIAKIYVHIGTTRAHGQKELLNKQHWEITAPWLISRTDDQSLNRIWIWGDWEPNYDIGLDFECKILP